MTFARVVCAALLCRAPLRCDIVFALRALPCLVNCCKQGQSIYGQYETAMLCGHAALLAVRVAWILMVLVGWLVW